MPPSATQQRQQAGRVSARGRAENARGAFDSNYLNIPQNVGLIKIESDTKPRKFDLLPYYVGQHNPYAPDAGMMHYELTYFVHSNIGPNEDKVLCPAKTRKQRCPICEEQQRMSRDRNIDKELVKALNVKERQLFNVMDLEEPNAGVQIWDISYHLFGKLLNKYITDSLNDPDDEYKQYFADPREGSSLKVSFAAKSFNGGNFYEAMTIDFRKRQTPYGKSIMEKVHNLENCLKILSYDELTRLFLQLDPDQPLPNTKGKTQVQGAGPVGGTPADDWDDNAAANTPAPTTGKRPAAAKAGGAKPAATPPAEEESWDDEPAAEEPAAKKPVAKKPAGKPATKPAAPPPTEEDSWDDEPAAEEAPAPKKPAGSPAGAGGNRAKQKAAPAPEPEPEEEGWDDADLDTADAEAAQAGDPPAGDDDGWED